MGSKAKRVGLCYYVCKSCGGENTAAGDCCCGNPVVMMGQFFGELKPDYVVPFKLDKNAVKAALNKHLLRKETASKSG